MRVFLIHFFLFVLFAGWHVDPVFAQQNCFSAIPICQSTYSQSTNYTGTGTLSELNATNQGCLTTGENNSAWYIVNTSAAGTLTFTLTPGTSSADYDFAVWNLTDKSCSDIMNGLAPIRCNYASIANSTAGGLTGLSTTATSPSYGAAGPSFSSAISASAGETYVILINNNSSSATGYTLNFGGSAVINDNIKPDIKADTIPSGCQNPTFVKILLTENVKCNSIAPNGSDFTISPASVSISNAISTACSNGSNFTNLIQVNFSAPIPPGTYTLSVVNGSDGNTLVDNCNNQMNANTNFSFTVQPPLQLSLTLTPGCGGQPTGIINASATGGNAPYQFKLNNGAYSSNNIYSGLGVGSYTVYVKDALGCIKDTVINLNNNPVIQITNLVISNPLCFGSNTGSVTVTAVGGTAPFSYNVNTQPYQGANTLNNLGPGNYVVHVKDAVGCIEDTVIFISSPGQLVINNIGVNHTTCNMSNGSISATGFGGIPPYQWKLNNGSYQSGSTFTNLASATYTITIKDANNCTTSSTVSVNSSTSVNITGLNKTNPTCQGANGSITVLAVNGSAPYTYSINSGGTYVSNNVFSGLSSGTYTLIVKDNVGCTDTGTVTLTAPGNLSFSGANVVKPTCTSTGSIMVSGSGGTLPYSFALNNNPYSASNSFTGLSAGTYTIHLKDANNCIHDTIINLQNVSMPAWVSLPKVHPNCSFPNSGTITANVSGGTAPIQFTLNGGTPTSGNVFNNLGAGTYTINVTDANGCTLSTTVTLNQTNTVSIANFSRTHVGCFGTPSGTINMTIANGNSPYQYSLNGGFPQGSGSFTGLSAGSYTVVGTDASGCTISTVVVIKSSAIVQLNSISVVHSTCFTPPTGSVTVNGTVSYTPVSYQIIPGGSNSTGIFNNLSAGTYTVRVKDPAGCHVDTVITITAPPPLYFTNVQIVRPPCWGGVGSISLSGAGGNPPYQYRLNNGVFGTTHSWSNLSAGTYTVRLLDANGCYKDTVIQLIQPPPIHISGVTLVNAPCNGSAQGSITVSATGGSPPFTYALGTGPYGSNTTFNNLGPGTYVVHIKDSLGCIKDSTFTIIPNGNFLITNITRVKPSCYGDANGSISVTVSGGVTPYQYNINGGANQASNTFTGLGAGTYTIEVLDNSSCQTDSVVVLTQPVPLVITGLVKNSPLCAGVNNGSASITGSGGTPSYTYKIDNGSYTATSTFSGLSAGTHTIYIKDSKNCITDTVFTLTAPPSVLISNIAMVPAGCTPAGGSFTITATGGTSPYQYSLNTAPFGSANTFGNLSGGTYTVHVRDANNCQKDSVIQVLMNPQVLLTSLNYDNFLCAGGMNGSITAIVTTPNMPLFYSINGGPAQTNGNFTNLSIGTYTLHVQNGMGCFIDTILTIQTAPPIIVDSLDLINTTCHNSTDGQIQVFSSSGLGSHTYALNLGSFGSNNLFQNLPGGNYTVHIRDTLLCQLDTVVNIASPLPLVINNILLQHPTCDNATDGAITIQNTGGTPPYLYALNTSLFTTNNAFNNLFHGTYTVHVKDSNGCVTDTVVNLPSNNPIHFINVNVQGVSCKNGNDGSISLTATGGVAPYSYSLNTIPNGNSGTFANLVAGTYSIQVLDNLGCAKDTVITITEPSSQVEAIWLGMTPNQCKGDSAGSITFTAIGGTTPYLFQVNNFGFYPNTTYSNLAAGNYTITVQDDLGCLDDTVVYVTEPDTSVQLVFIGSTPLSCVGVDDAGITVSAQYGFPPYTFYFMGNNVGMDTSYSPLAAGNYVVEVYDSIGCKSTGKYIVDPTTQEPYIEMDSLRAGLCKGDQDGYLGWDTYNGYPPYNYWFNSMSIGTQNWQDNLGVGTYMIEVEDDRGCKADTTITIIEGNQMELEIEVTPAKCDGLGDDGAAIAHVTGGFTPYEMEWGTGTDNKDLHLENIRYGTYHAIVKDDAGCADTASFTIEYDPCCLITMPNAFSPNGDHLNDIFLPIRYGYITVETFEIYNRWGNRVYQSNVMDDGWNGKLNGVDCEVGVYYYIFKYRCHLNDKIFFKRGDVTLIR